jgi:hypothetical protein
VGNYDDGVYYTAAAGLVGGRLPYRDFLLLHPPGILLLLAPFAALAHLLGDPAGFAAARLAWMLLGAANTVLVWRIGRHIGPVAALVGAAWYAVSFPAVYVEHSTLLEAPATTVLLLACALLSRPAAQHRIPALAAAAGALLGFGSAIKIWGVVPLIIVAGWLLLTRRAGQAAWLLAGGIGATTAVCLPFFAAAPRSMWNQVVRDQLSRPRSDATVMDRLAGIAGLGGWHPGPAWLAGGMAMTGLVVVIVLACSLSQARLYAALATGLSVFLLVTPTWFTHYAGLTAAPLALTIGAASQRLWTYKADLVAPRLAVAAVAGVLVFGQAVALSMISLGSPFPRPALAAAAYAPAGCVTADDPVGLIETDTLRQNLRRGCALVVDLGGESHDVRAAAGTSVSRVHNPVFQQRVREYLMSGSRAILMRFTRGHGFDRCTSETVRQWKLLARSGRFEVRMPIPVQPCPVKSK